MNISDVNGMVDLSKNFGDIAEHAPWVARNAQTARPFADREHMIKAFQDAIFDADPTAQLALIRAHPDLAGKAKLTQDSAAEQKGAGLDTLTQSELAIFTRLNETYRNKFEFPFIFAVKGADKYQILESFQSRIGNNKVAEFAMALEMVSEIIRFRLEDRVAA